jgi:alkylhydroperoxidase family enzyme
VTTEELLALTPDAAGPVRVPPAPVRSLRPLARIVALGAARVTKGPPPNIFRTLGRHPRLFRAWLRYSGRLMPNGTLPRVDAELVILRVAHRSRSAYEWRQHVGLGRRAGLTPEAIAACAGHGEDALTPRQRTFVAATDELLADRRLSDGTWDALQRELGDERKVIELCLLVGQYQGLATALGGLGVQVER